MLSVARSAFLFPQTNETPAGKLGVSIFLTRNDEVNVTVLNEASRRASYSKSADLTDLRYYQPTHISVILFNIRRYVVMPGGYEPTLAKAERLYERWFGVPSDDETSGQNSKQLRGFSS